ncbi:MAG: DUF6054 family protein [Bacillota bacterium]
MMANATLKGTGNARSIASLLESEITNSGITNEMVYKVQRNFGTDSICLMVFEKFYYRNGSRASLTVLVSEQGDQVTVDVTGSGGGQHIFFKFNFGAESNFVQLVKNILIPKGFRVVSE